MEWTVVTVIVSLVGLVATVAKPLATFSRTFASTATDLTASIKGLEKTFDRFVAENKESHGRIYDKLDAHGTQLEDHERRIVLLEHDL